MTQKEIHLVTGSFGYLGKYITGRLLDAGKAVRTLTGKTTRRRQGEGSVEIVPFEFEHPERLVEKLRGVEVVYNTYWVRFSHGQTTYGQAVANSQNLIHAAAAAGVRRFVHISITKPDEGSELPYFRGKAVIEKTLKESGLSYAIIRPTVLFGNEDILINNIAWLLRRMPMFGIFGDGEYRIQPVYVDDVAELAVELGARDDNIIIDAVGPETFSFEGLVRRIAEHLGIGRRKLVHISPRLALTVGRVLGMFVRDVLITPEEIAGLMQERLVSEQKPTCETSLSRWLSARGDALGAVYASELGRHYR